MEVLQSVIDNPDATETVKNEALAEMNAIANEIEKEANIEALLVSKGFEDCVAVMNGNQINVVVSRRASFKRHRSPRSIPSSMSRRALNPLT